MSSAFPGMDKKPLSYDQYESTLDAKDLRKAEEELHETDNTRESALAQIREFIAKHPQIIRCRTDCIFLLKFLRVRKFNVQAACEILEAWLMAISIEAEFYEVRLNEWDKHFVSQVVLPVGPDDKGRMVVVCRYGVLDSRTVTPEEQIRLLSLVLQTFFDVETYQVNGMVVLMDFQATTVAHFTMWTVPKLKTLITAINDILTIRLKEVHLINLPKFAKVVVDICMTFMKPKLQKRIKFHKSLEELRAAVDNSVLPTIYGGQLSLDEANDRFRKRVEQERDRILLLNEFVFDPTIPNPNATNYNRSGLHSEIANEAVIGSFRKLNVD
ncbi:alpha-tocopherol transfer protein-like isoform X1 [Armigeres subalbatus]|uniref:alpha-tocopherol transfer protein-like isoform X1 n=1 Tax=Armigeres subalbatus TaxID=124917 RepID=UPI002ED07C7D